MKIRIIDTEPSWLAHATRVVIGLGHTLTEGEADLYLVSDRQMGAIVPGKTIVLTGQATIDGAAAAYRAGAVDYRAKDFRPAALVALLTDWVMWRC